MASPCALPAADTSSLSLPCAPLPYLRSPHRRPSSISSHGPQSLAVSAHKSDKKQRYGEVSSCRSKAHGFPLLDDEKVIEDGFASWTRLGRLLSSHVPLELGPFCLPEAESSMEQFLSRSLVTSSEDTFSNIELMPWHFSFSAAAVQSTPPPRQKQEDPKGQDYHVNVGYAIRTLREELPAMFYEELSYDIYRDDIVFRDPMNTFGGVENYKLIFWALRFHGQIFFKALWVDIFRIWQPSDNVIVVRWQVRGIPRVPWEAQGIFDGTSEYKLDKDGKIYEHKIDNVALNSRPKFKVPTVADLLRVADCPSAPKPTFFEQVEMRFWFIFPYLLQFTWVRYYLALKGTMGLKKIKWSRNFVGA